ncbi:UNVERIFIED_CONTAM: hypothetical protein HDU68_008122 [Siphonaria sp. JEL0065]|nr:hypothetical protein HDU68_008122 [Siphonaria sp. JEL0065]
MFKKFASQLSEAAANAQQQIQANSFAVTTGLPGMAGTPTVNTNVSQRKHAELVDPGFSTTLDTIPGFRIVRTLGLVKGASLNGNVLGNSTHVANHHFDNAVHDLLGNAAKLGANAVVKVAFDCSANLFAHGTAVVVAPESS